MNTKQLISFIIASSTILIASIIITITVILPTKPPSKPAEITAYAFNFNLTNDASIYKLTGDNRLKLSNDVEFKPTKATEFSENFVSFKGASVNDGVEYATTKAADFVCVIPFTIFNNFDDSMNFSVKVNIGAKGRATALADSVTYKIYDYTDKTYKSIDTGTLIAKTGVHFCLVAVAEPGRESEINFGQDSALINITISKS